MPGFRGQRAYAAVLAVIAISILVVGFVFKPEAAANREEQSPDITLIQGEIERIRQVAQRNSLRNTSARFNTVSGEAAAHALLVLPHAAPGWLIGENNAFLTATDSAGLASVLQVSESGRTVGVRRLSWNPGLPFVLAAPESPIATAPAPTLPLEELSPGSWVLMVTFGSSGNPIFSPGNYSGSSLETCGIRRFPVLVSSIPIRNDWLGAGVFDLDNNLLAIVASCDRGPAAIPVAALIAAASDSAGSDGVIDRMGMRVAEIDDGWRSVLSREQGLVVSDTWRGWPAERAGILPGDVIEKANGEPVRKLSEFSALMDAASEPVSLELRRAARTIQTEIAPVTPGDLAVSAIEVRTPPIGVELARVLGGSSVERAGLLEGDEILRLNGTKATAENVSSSLAQMQVEKPVLVLAQRRERTYATPVVP